MSPRVAPALQPTSLALLLRRLFLCGSVFLGATQVDVRIQNMFIALFFSTLYISTNIIYFTLN